MNLELSNKTILVTGGAGFIGSNLCEALLEKGNQVVCLDNFATGKRENLEELLKGTNFTLIEGDIRKLEDCLKATQGVDYVLHQAALGSVPSPFYGERKLYAGRRGYSQFERLSESRQKCRLRTA